MVIKQSSDIHNVLMTKSRIVIEEVSKKVYETLVKVIKSEIYDGDTPKRYQRTYDFLNAFQLQNVKTYSDKLTRELIYNWRKMRPPKRVSIRDEEYLNYTHGDAERGIDRRKDLWWILNNADTNLQSSEFGGALNIGGSGYLEVFNAYLQRDFWKWVDAAAKKQGLKRLK